VIFLFGSLKNKLKEAVSKITDKIYSKGGIKEDIEPNETSDVTTSEGTTDTEKTTIQCSNNGKNIETKISYEKESSSINTVKNDKGSAKSEIGFFDRFKLMKTIKKVLGKEVVITEDDIEDVLEEMELELLEADVAYDVVEKIISSLKEQLVGKKISPKENPEEVVINALKKAIEDILSQNKIDIYQIIEEKKKKNEPAVFLFVGINGTGKTTTISKLGYILKEKGYSVVLAAGDTFRAGAIEQLEEHGRNIGVKVIRHQKGADSAAVIYDAIKHAKARGINVVLADTAGRQTTNTNLMDEIKKVARVVKPDLIIFVGDALTGNDAITQAEEFNQAVNIDGVILTKIDADAKGGAALSIAYAIGKPILFLGVGQRYCDLMEFDVNWMVNKLFGEDENMKKVISTERDF